MPLFRKPKLSKEEEDMLRQIERGAFAKAKQQKHEAFLEKKIAQAKAKGRRRAEGGRFKRGLKGVAAVMAKDVAPALAKASKEAQKISKRLEKEYK